MTATAEQAKAIGEAYMAERRGTAGATPPPKLEDLVDIAKVPLKHAFGTPHNQRPANDMNAAEERAALERHYAQSGVDPDKAHLGDPLEMKDQERLKAEIKKMLPGDKSEISGLPIFYQGYDDGWIYQANDHTRASGTAAQASDHHAATNENSTNQSKVGASPEKLADRPASRLPILQSGIDRARIEYESAVKGLPKIVKLIDDLKAEKPLTEDRVALNAGIVASLKRAGIKFDYQKVDVDQLRAKAAGEEKYRQSIDLTDPAAVQAAAALLSLQTSEALAGGRFNTVRMQQAGSILERLKLVPELYASLGSSALGRTTALKTSTALLGTEAAEDGPVDYDAALKEMTGLLSDAGIIGGKATEAPDILGDMSTDEEATKSLDADNVGTPVSSKLGTLSTTDIAAVEQIFIGKPSTFDRSQPTTIPSQMKAEILSSGKIEAIELFGLPIYLTDPRGNEQTQARVDKLKMMVRNKLVECGMTEELAWGGEVAENAVERAKERFVPKGEGGVSGARRADLSFRINWRGKVYIIDINTVDVLKSGLMTKSERIAAEGLRLNRLIRLNINEELPANQKLEEYAGKIGTIPKGKDMTDGEWEAAAKEWVDSFLDCDGPLDADVYLDPESSHPWPSKE